MQPVLSLRVTVYPGTGRTYSRCYFLETSCRPKGGKDKLAKNRSELKQIDLVLMVLRFHQRAQNDLSINAWSSFLTVSAVKILNKVSIHCWAHLTHKQEYKNISDLTET